MSARRTLRPAHDPHRLAFLIAAGVASDLCRVPLDDVLKRGTPGTCRLRRVRRARGIALYLLHTVQDVTIADVARAAGRSKQKVSQRCHDVEDMREDPRLDALVARAEEWFLARMAELRPLRAA